MGDVNGKCKACQAMEGRPFLGNSEIWDPRKLAAVNKPNLKRSNLQADSKEVDIDLDLGNMIIETRKLDKRSSFNIESPLGTVGIRG